MAMKKRVLFVCFGNTCRSPMAEAIFKKLVAEGGISDQWDVDSAGTSNWALGSPPDNRALGCLARHGLSSNHRGRQITKSDFVECDNIFCMDTKNLSLLEQFSKDVANTKAHILLLGSLDPHEELIISDPFSGGSREYERAYEQCHRCIQAFLRLNAA
uniref:low molecular weight phosphotyrosine protein phosphatase-like n=1 Tax=Myxine glutinosa TaxID=7769 RepID=UPI00358FE746